MTSRRTSPRAVGTALLLLAISGCGPDEPAPGPEATETPSVLSAAQLESAPVPTACEHPAGDLVYGTLPLVPDDMGGVWLARDDAGDPRHLITDLRGDEHELLGLLDCSAGGVGWPQTIVLYAEGPVLLGAIDLGGVELTDLEGVPVHAEHVVVDEWVSEPGVVHATLRSYTGAGFDIRTWDADLRWQQGTLVITTEFVSGPVEPLP